MKTKETTKAVSTARKTEITTQVLNKIEVFKNAGQIKIPKDYSPENALQAAYLILSEQKKDNIPVLDYCTQSSIANALLKLVVFGLNPLKGQVYFIPYGKDLQCVRDYGGNILLAKRFGNLEEINAVTIYKEDEFEFEVDSETGRKKIKTHKQTLKSLGGEVVGAYAVMKMKDGSFDTEIMNIDQIITSWKQGSAYRTEGSPAHKKFPDQMAEKTVINRACKLLIRGSDDNILFDEPDTDVVKADMQHDINTEANKEEISLDETKIIDVEAETVDETVENIEAKSTKIEETPNVKEVKKEEVKEEIKIESTRTNVDNKKPKVLF